MKITFLKSKFNSATFPLELFGGKTRKEPLISTLSKFGGSIVEVDEETDCWEVGSERELGLIIRKYEKSL